jgi:hypothetical protein
MKDERIYTVQKWIKGEKTQDRQQKNPAVGMDVCVVLVARTIIWNIKVT